MHVDLQYNNQFQVSRVSSKRLQSLAIDVLMNNCTVREYNLTHHNNYYCGGIQIMFLKIASHGQTSSQPVHSSHQTHSTGSQLTNHSTISVTTRYVIIYEDHALIILLLLI